MLFNSWPFILFVVVVFLLYYLPLFEKLQVEILIIASLLFYAFSDPMLVLLLVASALGNAITSYYVNYSKSCYKKPIAVIGVSANLLILAFFKYSPLVAFTFFNTEEGIGNFLLHIPLPIGISFYTFKGISLVVDVFTKEHFKNVDDVIPKSIYQHIKQSSFFISFFPQLLAGPISKSYDFLSQIRSKKISDITWSFVFKSLVMGYFLKMVVADNMKDFTYWMSNPQSRGSGDLILMLFGYSSQIFADFAGYSLIAVGLASLFGYSLPQNFNFPYISTSFKEFWKRWHITLSNFLMEYLYIPLGGNRKGKFRTYINLFVTMSLGGLWHGAAWSYMIWGMFHGVALVIERFLTRDRSKVAPYPLVIRVIQGILVYILVTYAWLFFKLPEFSLVVTYTKCIFTNIHQNLVDPKMFPILLYSLPVVIYHFSYLFRESCVMRFMKKYEWMTYGILLYLIIVNSGSPGTFVYFQF